MIKPNNENQGCPKCGGSVFEAERITEKGRNYHKRCFVCCKCKRPQDDKLQVFVGFDSKIYCSVCYPRPSYTTLPGEVETSRIKATAGQGCPRCGGKVFDAEKMTVKSGTFHKHCFNCASCGQSLNYSNFTSHQENVYCHGCFQKNFDTRSKSVGPPDTKTIKGSSSQNCPRCGGIVFDLEKVQTKQSVIHRACLSCLNCKKPLLPSNFFDAPDGDVYCSLCYASKFGHKRSKSVGPSNTRTIKAEPGEASCLCCGYKVFEAEKVSVHNGCYHVSCYKCVRCKSLLNSSTANNGNNGKMYCNGCFRKKRQQTPEENQTFVKSFLDTVSIPASDDDPDMCVRCSGKVFAAERRAAKTGVYHTRCFSCSDCGKMLDFSTVLDNPEGDIICKSCFSKKSTSHFTSFSSDAGDLTVIKPSKKLFRFHA